MRGKQRRPASAWVRVRRKQLDALRQQVEVLRAEKVDAVREAERLGRVEHFKLMEFCLQELGRCNSYNDEDHRCSLFRGHERYSTDWPHQVSISRPSRNGGSGFVVCCKSWPLTAVDFNAAPTPAGGAMSTEHNDGNRSNPQP